MPKSKSKKFKFLCCSCKKEFVPTLLAYGHLFVTDYGSSIVITCPHCEVTEKLRD